VAIAFNSSHDLGDNNGVGNSFSVAYNNTAANLLTIFLIMGDYDGSGGGSFDDISSVVYAGVNLGSPVCKVANLSGTPASSARFQYLYAGYNLPTGSNTFVVNCTNTNARFILVVVADYTGANNNPPDNQTTQDATAATATIMTLTTTLATNADNCWLALGLSLWNVSGAVVTPTGVTLRQTGSTYGIPIFYDSNGAETPPGNHSVTTAMSVTSQQAEISHVLMSFAPLAAINQTSINCCVSP
jgi:hypothetical protein